ncbi:MAG: hypothetical protein HRU15_17650 [Planctomycetes bacterium]|nr:hypothetical protein [Planctomycetota bacterium]
MRIFDIFKNELSQYLIQNPVDVWYADYGSRLYYHMRYWEMTNDPAYRDRIEWFLKETLKVQKPNGDVPFHACSDWVKKDYFNARTFSKKDYHNTYGFAYTLLEYYDLTGDKMVGDGFKKFAKVDNLHKFIGYGAGRSIVAAYYRLTGDESYRDAALHLKVTKKFDRLFPKPIDQMSDEEVTATMQQWLWANKTVHPFYIISGMIRSMGELQKQD